MVRIKGSINTGTKTFTNGTTHRALEGARVSITAAKPIINKPTNKFSTRN
jgi:hypothetical protein